MKRKKRNSPIAVRLVTPANATVLSSVAAGVFDRPPRSSFTSAFLSDPRSVLIVALARRVVVGMATGLVYPHPDHANRLFVNELSVAPRWRRRGIGRELIAALLARGRELGCTSAWVATEIGNDAARATYAGLGGRMDLEPAVVFHWVLGQRRGEARGNARRHAGRSGGASRRTAAASRADRAPAASSLVRSNERTGGITADGVATRHRTRGKIADRIGDRRSRAHPRRRR